MTGIFQINPESLQVAERFSQDRHVRQMKRHVVERSWRWLSLHQCDRHVLVPDRDPIVEFELFLEAKRAPEPFRASLGASYGQTKMAYHAQSKWHFHDEP